MRGQSQSPRRYPDDINPGPRGSGRGRTQQCAPVPFWPRETEGHRGPFGNWHMLLCTPHGGLQALNFKAEETHTQTHMRAVQSITPQNVAASSSRARLEVSDTHSSVRRLAPLRGNCFRTLPLPLPGKTKSCFAAQRPSSPISDTW